MRWATPTRGGEDSTIKSGPSSNVTKTDLFFRNRENNDWAVGSLLLGLLYRLRLNEIQTGPARLEIDCGLVACIALPDAPNYVYH
jgi:hypothetical protein